MINKLKYIIYNIIINFDLINIQNKKKLVNLKANSYKNDLYFNIINIKSCYLDLFSYFIYININYI